MTNRLYLPYCLLLPFLISNYAQGQTFIARGNHTWAYSFLEPADHDWKAARFDDAAWKRGTAPLGFGESPLGTVISIPCDTGKVPIVTRFRTTFAVDLQEPPQRLLLKIRADDGFVVYLNDQELVRHNLPPRPLQPATVSIERLSGVSEQRFQKYEFAADLLVSGRNTMAVAVHQAGDISSDLYLDLSLRGLQHGIPDRAILSAGAEDVTRAYNSLHFIDENTGIPDGFLDGGRDMQVDEFGTAVSGREIIRIDRQVDSVLAKYIEFARSDELHSLPEIDRATRVARYVDRVFTPPAGRQVCQARSLYFSQRYPSQELLLGDIVDVSTVGVCRHRALLFKILADEAGLKSTLVRGNYFDGNASAGHAWNELILLDGKRVVVDLMNPQPDFYFPAVGESSLRWYRTVANNPKYAASDGKSRSE